MSLSVITPTGVVLDTVQICNARCPFCPLFVGNSTIDRSTRTVPIMPQELFDKVVSEIANWDVLPNSISMANNGETLQDPKMLEKLSTLKRLDLAKITSILTNGHLMNETKSKALINAGVRNIILGFDGATKEV